MVTDSVGYGAKAGHGFVEMLCADVCLEYVAGHAFDPGNPFCLFETLAFGAGRRESCENGRGFLQADFVFSAQESYAVQFVMRHTNCFPVRMCCVSCLAKLRVKLLAQS